MPGSIGAGHEYVSSELLFVLWLDERPVGKDGRNAVRREIEALRDVSSCMVRSDRNELTITVARSLSDGKIRAALTAVREVLYRDRYFHSRPALPKQLR